MQNLSWQISSPLITTQNQYLTKTLIWFRTPYILQKMYAKPKKIKKGNLWSKDLPPFSHQFFPSTSTWNHPICDHPGGGSSLVSRAKMSIQLVWGETTEKNRWEFKASRGPPPQMPPLQEIAGPMNGLLTRMIPEASLSGAGHFLQNAALGVGSLRFPRKKPSQQKASKELNSTPV